MSLFEQPTSRPLADRLRPKSLDDVVGQKHLVGANRPLRELLDQQFIPSMIFWGPPGIGKTTVAQIIATHCGAEYEQISAVTSGIADVKKIIERAQTSFRLGVKTILFIDEIHRFNKAQQDALLPWVENGTVVLIGATTENPSFEVIAPLLSRSRVFTFESIPDKEISALIDRALSVSEGLSGRYRLHKAARQLLLDVACGDARAALTTLEIASQLAGRSAKPVISREHIGKAASKNPAQYDKNGEKHYTYISAFIKSMRGSSPDAAVYWMCRMLDGGEDPKFLARRMMIFAAEDIGNADAQSLVLTNACFESVAKLGLPECEIPLTQTAIYLARAPKSREVVDALGVIKKVVQKTRRLPVPMHLRNASTTTQREMGYGRPEVHDDLHPQERNYLPSELLGSKWIP